MDRTTIKGIRQNFSPLPLTGDDLKETGLYVDTIEARTGSPYKSPIEDIFDDCTTTGSYNYIHLLLGHRGCGKSTELNKLEIKFIEEGFAIRKIDCEAETNFAQIGVEDILILISNALLDICKEKKIKINQDDIEKLNYFFVPKVREIVAREESEIGIGGSIGFTLPLNIFSLSAKVKSQIMNTSEEMTTIRINIKNNFAEWNRCIDNIIEKIKENDSQKYPIIIFENFDKIVPVENAIEIFGKGYLEKIRTYIIYTFPISLSYSEKFGTIEQYVTPHFFPMLDIYCIRL